jgi:hypothetical protein
MQQDLNLKSAKMVKLNQSKNNNIDNWKAALPLGVDIFTRLINENWDDFIIDIATYTVK